MSSRQVLLFLFFFTVSASVFAQKKDEYKQPRILILLDGSSSMVNEWVKGKSRFNSAGDIILRLMDSVYQLNDQVEFALRVYGHQHGVPENNCYDTRREVMFSKNNYTQMSLRLASLTPVGVSPIAYSLKMAAESDFTEEHDYAYSLVLITDGGESCGGNICDVVKTLLDKKIQFKPYIVSLVDYAPLKEQYSCLGNYLSVSKPSDVAPAIHTITEAYRKMLRVPVARTKPLPVANIPTPSVQKINVPPVKVVVNDPETTTVASPPVKQSVQPVKKQPEPEPVREEPPKPATVRPSTSKIKVDTSFFTKEHIPSLKRYGFERINYALFWSTSTPRKRKVPTFPLPKPEPANVIAPSTPAKQTPSTSAITKPTPKPATSNKSEIKQADYTISVEPAQETLLEVYFTDGKGKFYSTTPPVQLVDAKTGAEVKRFYRTVDAAGNPDPQKIQAGSYTMVIGKTGNYKTKNITIQPSSTNKVTVIVKSGTLIFRYDDNPKRPVKEFNASVRKTFQSNTNVFQKCSEEREYDPGNYHIEINTLPMMVRNIDLEFGWSYIIDIEEPGFVQFTNVNAIGKVSLWAPLGDQYARFHAMEINGNLQAQNLRLQPGIYEVHWRENANTPMAQEKVQQFFIKSNETTEVEIK